MWKAVAFGGELYVACGNSGTFRQSRKYSPRLDTWENLAVCPVDIRNGSIAIIGDEIFIAGGGVSPYNQTAKYATFTVKYRNQAVAEVKHGQTVFYESDTDAAVLRLNETIVEHGESIVAEDGYLVTDLLVNDDDYIRGWVK